MVNLIVYFILSFLRICTLQIEMKHLYEDIFRVTGELGPWQMRRLGLLWLLMFLVGAHFSIPDYMERGTEEFICRNPNMPDCKVIAIVKS